MFLFMFLSFVHFIMYKPISAFASIFKASSYLYTSNYQIKGSCILRIFLKNQVI